MMTRHPELSLPCYFGAGDALFGTYHAAAGGVAARNAVLLCPPFGPDLIRSHRVYRQIADALAVDGIAALRFDYYATGDSAGNSVEVDWARCVADTAVAADELRRRSGCTRVAAFGARLGATVALTATAEASLTDVMVWDPIVDVRAYVAALDALQASLRMDLSRFLLPRTEHDAAEQWLGFRISTRWRQQLMELTLTAATVPVQLFDSRPPGLGFDYGVLTSAPVIALQPTTFWDDLGRLEHAILLPRLVRAVCDHMRKAA